MVEPGLDVSFVSLLPSQITLMKKSNDAESVVSSIFLTFPWTVTHLPSRYHCFCVHNAPFGNRTAMFHLNPNFFPKNLPAFLKEMEIKEVSNEHKQKINLLPQNNLISLYGSGIEIGQKTLLCFFESTWKTFEVCFD